MARRIALVSSMLSVAALAAVVLAACGGDSSAQEGGSSEVTQLILVIQELDAAGFHDTEEEIADGEIPATARRTALEMEALVRAAEWPEELQEDAQRLADELSAAASAYDGEDMEAALEAATAVHDVEHEFSARVWNWAGEQTGVADLVSDEDH